MPLMSCFISARIRTGWTALSLDDALVTCMKSMQTEILSDRSRSDMKNKRAFQHSDDEQVLVRVISGNPGPQFMDLALDLFAREKRFSEIDSNH